MERELQLMERENRMLRQRTRNSGDAIPEAQSKFNVRAVSELLNNFDGTEGLFRNWEKQARLLISIYRLDDNNAKILLGMRLKDKALEWLHSRPEHIELGIEELFSEMRKIFDHRQSKLKLRKQFEERMWKSEETFSTYFYEKIILANRVPVEEEEMLEYLIEGIPNIQIRNQARLQQFESNAELLKAFENISLTEGKSRTDRESKIQNKEQKESASRWKGVRWKRSIL